MTRNDIAISLKPLKWEEDELDNGTPVLTADYDVYEAYIKENGNGTVTLTIFYIGNLEEPKIKYTRLTMEEANDITRLLQVDSFCEYFNLDNPI